MRTTLEVHIFRLRTIIMQSFKIKEYKLLELQVTLILHNVSTQKVV